ncbi:MAG: ribonuclease III [Candidatus Vogelbacteria bacterium]|nr:ribonuclease III [Candidatus Vogelbacteria bacterium]
MPDFAEFETKIGLAFKNKNLLKQAFLHRSYINENPTISLDHNERLEFLGDAVLELVVTDYLFCQYPDRTEGELTAYRAALVNAETLAQVAGDLGVNDYLLLSRGEQKDAGRARQTILANTFESIIGAIYLDRGYGAARDFITRFLFPRTAEIVGQSLWQDAKSFFQEQAQAAVNLTPRYEVLEQTGPDHDKTFTVGIYLREELVATGSGSSKQRAEQEAARQGLLVKGWNK